MPTTTGLTIPFTGLRKQYNNLREEILAATDEVLRSGQLMNGNNVAEFEHWLKRRNRVKYAVTCHSGTQALEILACYFREQQVTPDPPTVLIPSMTYVATANAFARAKWNIQIIDINQYGIFDYRKIPQLTSYQAVVLVGLYGASLTHYGGVRQWTDWTRKDMIVIEDAAQHWLAADCTRIGNAAAVSFDPMKNLACYGNGGAVLTNDLDLADFAQSWRDNGKSNQYQVAASNSRMSELDCAHMMVKVRHLDAWQARRAQIAEFWREKCKDTGIRCLIDESNAADHAYHKFVVDLDNRDTVKIKLAERKVETRVHYERPLHELSGWLSALSGPGFLSAASSFSRRVLSLPFYPELTDLEVEYIIEQLLDLA
jgi:dTDP-4-amino-4,6-dideoxygalactose transaminase